MPSWSGSTPATSCSTKTPPRSPPRSRPSSPPDLSPEPAGATWRLPRRLPSHQTGVAIVKQFLAAAVLAATTALSSPIGGTHAQTVPSISSTTTYHTVTVDGLKIFYREAGPKDAPTILLLHGFPTSSRMYQGLMPLLADRYHVVAPDYPGFGNSDAPPHDKFAYTFDHITQVMDDFTQALG